MRDLATAVGGGKLAESVGSIEGASVDETMLSVLFEALLNRVVGLGGERVAVGERGEVWGPSRGLTGTTTGVTESAGVLADARTFALVLFGVVGTAIWMDLRGN